MSAEFEWFGDEILRFLEAQVDNRLLECALDLKDRSVQEAPVDTGDLRGNCAVSSPISGHSTTRTTVEIGYSLPYAIVQHEALEFRHPEGGKAKYLEDPYNANKEKYLQHVGKGLIP
jgi:hypothetical protein